MAMRLGRARETLGTDRHSGGNRLLRWQAQLSARHTGKPSIGSKMGELCEPLKQATLGPFGWHVRNDRARSATLRVTTIRLTFGRRLLPISTLAALEAAPTSGTCAALKHIIIWAELSRWHLLRRVIALSGCCDNPKWEVEASRCL